MPFLGWASHLQQAYFNRMDIPSWTLERPTANPLKSLRAGLPPSDNLLRHEPVPWYQRRIARQDFPWVEPANSLQWRFFKRSIDVLKARGNRVFVLLGPFNEHMLTDRSRERYHQVRDFLEAELTLKGVDIKCRLHWRATSTATPAIRWHPAMRSWVVSCYRICDSAVKLVPPTPGNTSSSDLGQCQRRTLLVLETTGPRRINGTKAHMLP